jgi:hypothetical protein
MYIDILDCDDDNDDNDDDDDDNKLFSTSVVDDFFMITAHFSKLASLYPIRI